MEMVMSSKVAQSIRRGLTQALAYAKNEARASDYRVHIPADINVNVSGCVGARNSGGDRP